MNKELIKKYKQEFDHWINGGNLLTRLPKDGTWSTLVDSDWNYTKPLQIIIDDEYVEFRKALAEGKDIEMRQKYSPPNMWQLLYRDKYPDRDFRTDFEYRIKPVEPKFKVGDWVRVDGVAGEFIGKVTYIDSNKDLTIDGDTTAYSSQAELWEPSQKDYCWHPNRGLVKVIENLDYNDECLVKVLFENVFKSESHLKSELEPFIGKLPSFIEDTK